VLRVRAVFQEGMQACGTLQAVRHPHISDSLMITMPGKGGNPELTQYPALQ